MSVISWNEKEDGNLSEAKLREKMARQGYSITRYTYVPGTYFPDHTHNIDKMDAVLNGQFKMTTPEGSAVLKPGDMLKVSRGVVHSAEVIGSEPVISLDGIKD